MTNLTLKQLRYFEALAQHGHFGRAADACSISQPALSMQIKELEQFLGGVLLERGARQIRLTKFGEEVAQREFLAETGQADLSRAPFEQRGAELFLQFLDLHRQRRLRDRAGIRCAAKMTMLGQRLEIAKLLERQICHNLILSAQSENQT